MRKPSGFSYLWGEDVWRLLRNKKFMCSSVFFSFLNIRVELDLQKCLQQLPHSKPGLLDLNAMLNIKSRYWWNWTNAKLTDIDPPLFCLESVLTHRIVSTKKDKTQACWQVCCGEGGHPHAAPSVLTTWLLFGFLQKARGRKEKQWLPCFQDWGNSGDITKIPGICICFPLFWLLNIAKEGF